MGDLTMGIKEFLSSESFTIVSAAGWAYREAKDICSVGLAGVYTEVLTMKTLFDQTYDGLKERGLSEVLFVKDGVGSVYSEAHFFFVVFPWIAVKGSSTMGSIPLR